MVKNQRENLSADKGLSASAVAETQKSATFIAGQPFCHFFVLRKPSGIFSSEVPDTGPENSFGIRNGYLYDVRNRGEAVSLSRSIVC
jgi:hypothetical protein